MNCPMCASAVADAALECPACQEELTPWRTIEASSTRLRQRGLLLASGGDFLGACLALLQAGLSNPRDEASLVDAARALWKLGRRQEAARWLENARRRSPQSQAARLLEAMANQAAPGPDPAPSAPPRGAEPQAARQRDLLRLPPLERKKKLLGRAARGQNLDLWKAALLAEQRWNGGPLAACPMLEAVAAGEEPFGALCYLAGLARWSQSDPGGALPWFCRSLERDPPVLNPVAYLLVIVLEHNQPGVAALLEPYAIAPPELNRVCDALQARLRGPEHRELLVRLEAVRI